MSDPIQSARDAYLGRQTRRQSAPAIGTTGMASIESSWIDVDKKHTPLAGQSVYTVPVADNSIGNGIDVIATSPTVVDLYDVDDDYNLATSESSVVIPSSYEYGDDIETDNDESRESSYPVEADDAGVRLSTSLSTLISGKVAPNNNGNVNTSHGRPAKKLSNLRIIPSSEMEKLSLSNGGAGGTNHELKDDSRHIKSSPSSSYKRKKAQRYRGSSSSSSSGGPTPFTDPTLTFIAATSLTFVAGISFSAGYALGKKSIKVI